MAELQTVWLEKEERWPEIVLSIEPSRYMCEVEIPRALVVRHAQALAEFDQVQGMLAEALRNAREEEGWVRR